MLCCITALQCIFRIEKELKGSITNQAVLQMSWINQDQLVEDIIYL